MSLTLNQILPNEALQFLSLEQCAVQISGVTEDSRKVKPNDIFFAIKGQKSDGEAYIPQAVKAGAAVIVLSVNCDQTALKTAFPDQIFIFSPFPRYLLAVALAVIYQEKPAFLYAVTGTNGKTSVADFTRQFFTLRGHHAASVGTLGVIDLDGVTETGHTTPDHETVYKTLNDLAKKGVTHLIFEASSHGLDQFRLDGLRFQASAFTNLTRDHMDYHESFAEYRSAKARLFAYLTDTPDGFAVINADDPSAKHMIDVCYDNNLPVLTYGKQGDHAAILSLIPNAEGQKLTVRAFDQEFNVNLPLVGEFQAYNVLAAALLSSKYGDLEDFKKTLKNSEKLKSVPGRMEFVGEQNNAGIYVDYAHTPDALETALKALRPHVGPGGKLIVLFGCGGDRDKGKRPLMGKAASDHADLLFVTDDNPRSEVPEMIRQEILQATQSDKTREIPGREAAIRAVIDELRPGDVALIAGKGHERGQIIGGVTHPFHDPSEVKRILECR